MFLTKFVDHGGRLGNAMQALSRWQHTVASSEALDVLYRVVCPTSYCRIRMAIEITSNPFAFFAVVDFVVAQNRRCDASQCGTECDPTQPLLKVSVAPTLHTMST